MKNYMVILSKNNSGYKMLRISYVDRASDKKSDRNEPPVLTKVGIKILCTCICERICDRHWEQILSKCVAVNRFIMRRFYRNGQMCVHIMWTSAV